jgi:hypothetical protein
MEEDKKMNNKLLLNIITIIIGIASLIISYATNSTWQAYIISIALIIVSLFNIILLIEKPYLFILFKEGSKEVFKITEGNIIQNKKEGGTAKKELKIDGFRNHLLEKFTSIFHLDTNNLFKKKIVFGYTNGVDIIPFDTK